jgi:hypothetical protein
LTSEDGGRKGGGVLEASKSDALSADRFASEVGRSNKRGVGFKVTTDGAASVGVAGCPGVADSLPSVAASVETLRGASPTCVLRRSVGTRAKPPQSSRIVAAAAQRRQRDDRDGNGGALGVDVVGMCVTHQGDEASAVAA